MVAAIPFFPYIISESISLWWWQYRHGCSGTAACSGRSGKTGFS